MKETKNKNKGVVKSIYYILGGYMNINILIFI